MVFICNMTMPQVTRPEVWRRFWKSQGVYVLEHSPDLVPCDFFPFPRLKKNLAGRNIPPAKSLNLLRGIPQKDYEKVFKDWIKSLKICVSVMGWYFDNLK